MHGKRWQAPAPGKGLCHGAANHERTNQSGSAGVGNAFKVDRVYVLLVQELMDQRQDFAHMVSGGQFGDHAAMLCVKCGLAKQGVGEQALVAVVQADCGFIAGSLDAKSD